MVETVEILTRREPRRRWSAEEKARLVAETMEPGAVITHVARRHGVAESCLHLWRKTLGVRPVSASPAGLPLIPVTISPEAAARPDGWPSPSLAKAVLTFPDGTRLEIGADFPAAVLETVIDVLRRRR